MSTPDEVHQMIDDLEARESRLTDWEREFVDSIKAQLGRGRALTLKQDETLERIWNSVTAKG